MKSSAFQLVCFLKCMLDLSVVVVPDYQDADANPACEHSEPNLTVLQT